jgi:(2Fe-2S) ferredoxin
LCDRVPVARAPIRRHVFVCSGRSCTEAGSAEVKEAFTRELTARGLLYGKASKGRNPEGSVLLTDCGSVGFCAVGAAVLVYPDGVWYAQVRAADAAEIVEEHVVRGRVVGRLALLEIPPVGETAGAAGGAPTLESDEAAAESDKTKEGAGS